MGVFRTDRTIHDVERGANLDLILRGMNGALNRFAEEVGEGLHAIALALATKDDNTAQVKELADRVRAVREKLKASVDAQQPKGD